MGKGRLSGLAILKLKLTKSYLRSTMLQERLSRLAILKLKLKLTNSYLRSTMSQERLSE